MDHDNRRRAFSEVVSLDAWHRGFTTSRKAVDLHVDVAFSTGRIGGEEASNVRFRLRLKKAEVVVIVPPAEPARIDKASVSRDTPVIEVESTETRKVRIEGQVGAGAGGVLGRSEAAAQANASAQLAASKSRDRIVTISQDSSRFTVNQVKTSEGDYAWIVEPAVEGALDGRPWDAALHPRLKVIDTRVDRSRGIEPAVRVEIRCRREDLDIQDIALKDQNWAALARDPLGRNRILAAEAVIRTRLFEAGLLDGDIQDPFAQITLCATIAESQ